MLAGSLRTYDFYAFINELKPLTKAEAITVHRPTVARNLSSISPTILKLRLQ